MSYMEQTRARWRDLGARLGMSFKPGMEGFLESPALLGSGAWWRAPGDDGERYRKFSQDPKWAKMIEDSIVGCLSGRSRGFSHHVFPFSVRSGKNIRSAVRVVVLFPRPYHHDMVITLAGLPQRFARALFRKRYIPIPDGGNLNRLLLVWGRNREQITELLSRKRIREGLKVFTGYFLKGVEIRDGGIILTLEANFPETNELKPAIEAMMDLAELFT